MGNEAITLAPGSRDRLTSDHMKNWKQAMPTTARTPNPSKESRPRFCRIPSETPETSVGRYVPRAPQGSRSKNALTPGATPATRMTSNATALTSPHALGWAMVSRVSRSIWWTQGTMLRSTSRRQNAGPRRPLADREVVVETCIDRVGVILGDLQRTVEFLHGKLRTLREHRMDRIDVRLHILGKRHGSDRALENVGLDQHVQVPEKGRCGLVRIQRSASPQTCSRA